MSGILWIALLIAVAIALSQIVERILRRAGIQPDEGTRDGGFRDVIAKVRDWLASRQPPQNS